MAKATKKKRSPTKRLFHIREMRCLVAGVDVKYGPDFFLCRIRCLESEIELGAHYAAAVKAAKDNGYSGWFSAFDELDLGCRVFNKLDWTGAGLYDINGEHLEQN